jgi:hypothetical protein
MQKKLILIVFLLYWFQKIQTLSDVERYPYITENKREIANRSEYFVTKEKLKYILFIFYNPVEETEKAGILK